MLAVIELALLCLVLQRVDTTRLTISPQHAHLKKTGDNLTVMCQADAPLTHCQFNFVKDEENWEGPLLDLSQGNDTSIDPLPEDVPITDYRYSGSGLKSGQCGITLHLTGSKRWMMGCRVQGATGGWKYAIMSFTADQSRSIPVTMTPQSIVALPGSSVSFLCKADGPLEWCRMYTPGSLYSHLYLEEGSDNSSFTSDYHYHGAGVVSGECGATFSSVTEVLNGYAFCSVLTPSGKWERPGIPFVVARAPKKPVLNVTSQTLSAGSQLEATCTVQGGRPVANISWYLGDEVLRRDDEDDVPDLVWGWPTSLQRITQELKRELKATDDGKELRCEAAHLTLSQPMVAKKTIRLSTTPEPQPQPHELQNATGCPPLTSQTVQISCSIAGEKINCSEPQEIGAEAELTCKPGFALHSSVIYRKIKCVRGNTWNYPVFDCHPDCGRRNTNAGAMLIAGGKDSKVGEFPWHVGIYRTSTNSRIPVQMCSGSLISPNVVISAAHCFWNDQYGKTYAASMFKMAAGKHSRLWQDADPSVQRRDVQQVVTNRLYRGRDTGFSADIAILRPDTPFNLNPKVNLVCVDWDNHLERRQLVEGNSGVVAGWGYTEMGEQSDSLKYVDLPFVTSETCLNSLSPPLQGLFTPDKICAGFVNRSTSVCRGDSGGGLVFRDPSSDKYYLRGITSIAFKPSSNTAICYSQLYAGFTRFSHYIAWTQNNV